MPELKVLTLSKLTNARCRRLNDEATEYDPAYKNNLL